ncbi:hypothetical protein HDU96_007800 [Phlyctochytrium bullatum]|nr:hypothetical protein HDU96_007800 [Phlyctochytrium bullatum]
MPAILTSLPIELLFAIAVHLPPYQTRRLLCLSRTAHHRLGSLTTSFSFALSNVLFQRRIPTYPGEGVLDFDFLGDAYLAAAIHLNGCGPAQFAMYCREKEMVASRVWVPCEKHCEKLRTAVEFLGSRFGAEGMRLAWKGKSWELPQLVRLNMEELVLEVLHQDLQIADQPPTSPSDSSKHDHTKLLKLDLHDAFSLACEYGYHKIASHLLSHPSLTPTYRSLDRACLRGHAEVVGLLLHDGRVDPSTNNNYLLRRACVKGDLDVFKRLYADPRCRGLDGPVGEDAGAEMAEWLQLCSPVAAPAYRPYSMPGSPLTPTASAPSMVDSATVSRKPKGWRFEALRNAKKHGHDPIILALLQSGSAPSSPILVNPSRAVSRRWRRGGTVGKLLLSR